MVVKTVTKGTLTWIQTIRDTLLPNQAVPDAAGDGFLVPVSKTLNI